MKGGIFFFPPVDNDFSIPSGKEEKGVSFKTALKTCPSEVPVVGEGGAWLLAGATGSCTGCLGLSELGLCFLWVRAMQWSQKHLV